jgi:hypothetical protein
MAELRHKYRATGARQDAILTFEGQRISITLVDFDRLSLYTPGAQAYNGV